MSSMSFPSTDITQQDRIVTRRIWPTGAMAAIAAAIVNAVIFVVATNVLAISPAFDPLKSVAPAMIFSVIGVIAATAVFALVARVARRPIPLFRVIALVALVLSLASPLFATSSLAGVTRSAVFTLIVMHVTTAAISVGLLTTRTRAG